MLAIKLILSYGMLRKVLGMIWARIYGSRSGGRQTESGSIDSELEEMQFYHLRASSDVVGLYQ